MVEARSGDLLAFLLQTWALVPLLAALIAWLVFREKVSAPTWAGVELEGSREVGWSLEVACRVTDIPDVLRTEVDLEPLGRMGGRIALPLVGCFQSLKLRAIQTLAQHRLKRVFPSIRYLDTFPQPWQ